MNVDELFDEAEQAVLEVRYNISNEKLATRVRSAPDMGGAMLVQLSEFMAPPAYEREAS